MGVESMSIRIEPLTAVLGARVAGIDPSALDEKVDEQIAETLRRALDEHQVIFLPGLHPTPDRHKALAEIFGTPEVHEEGREEDRRTAYYADEEKLILVIDSDRNAANFWHTDATFRKRPPAVSVIAIQVVPERGGDTLWLDTYRAFEALPGAVQTLARGLRAIHGHPGVSETNPHPFVRTHPRTGREALWINRGWTTGIEGISARQAKPLLEFFFEVMEQPEFTCRWSWGAGDVAVWDNRCTMHYALRDFGDAERRIHRVTVAGEVPA